MVFWFVRAFVRDSGHVQGGHRDDDHDYGGPRKRGMARYRTVDSAAVVCPTNNSDTRGVSSANANANSTIAVVPFAPFDCFVTFSFSRVGFRSSFLYTNTHECTRSSRSSNSSSSPALVPKCPKPATALRTICRSNCS